MSACLLLATLCFFASPLIVVEAASSGLVGDCNPRGNFGCSSWEGGDRLKCNDPDAGHMDWALKPVRTPNYVIEVDTDGYIPDTLVSVWVKVKAIDFKYRGLLLTAVNENGDNVGSWQHADTENGIFHTPPKYCPDAVLHNSADLKPYETRHVFKAPAKGTGKITFLALLKRGPANTGEFYYPASDPAIDEIADGKTADVEWRVAAVGASCTMTCQDRGGCNKFAMERANSAEKLLESVFAQNINCQLPILSDCSRISPTSSASGECWFHSQTSCSSSFNESINCDSIGDESNGKRLCACGGQGAGNGASRKSTTALSVSAIAAFAALAQMPRASQKLVLVLMVVLFALGQLPKSSAHNWMHTPARALMEASTTAPCRGRKGSDTHAQVGPGQTFAFKWATGHSSHSYVAIVTDEAWLAKNNFVEMLNDYIDSAPKNFAQEKKWKRYHGTNSNDLSYYTSGGDGQYKRQVPPDDPHFIDHPDAATKALFEYNDDIIEGDRAASYKSAKYPWLLHGAKYFHITHLPRDYDAIQLQIPSFAKAGHHVVHWRWRGYYDCADVDYFKKPVENVYGKDTGKFSWNRIDHCAYVEPREISTQCMVATNADACKEAMEKRYKSNNPKTQQTFDFKRLGINVVPMTLPETSLFRDQVDIPYKNRTCVNNWDLTNLDGTVTESSVSWSQWKRTTKAGKKCKAGRRDSRNGISLKRAILMCTQADCAGISWKGSGDATKASSSESFIICKSVADADLDDDEEYTTFAKQSPPSANSASSLVAQVKFQSTLAPTPGGGVLADNGATYSAKGGKTYGWNCPMKAQSMFPTEREISRGKPEAYFRNVHDRCDDGSVRTWEYKVDNGFYKVTVQHGPSQRRNINVRGTIVEGMRIHDRSGRNSPDTTIWPATVVEVRDGRLTLQAYREEGNEFGNNHVQAITSITIEKFAGTPALNPIWLPASSGTKGVWWQKEFSRPQKVGIVSISVEGARTSNYNCRQWFLFKGQLSGCPEKMPGGPFKLPTTANSESAVVRVSDTPCNDANGCDSSKSTVCNTVTIPVQFFSGIDVLNVDCGGKRGKYVHIELPGRQRILDFNAVNVNLDKPSPPSKDALVCYGVEARTQTNTAPEFIISEDPKDPKFYSTCFARERVIEWLPVKIQKQQVRWKFNGKCVSCESYAERLALESSNASSLKAINWHVSDVCIDCARAVSKEKQSSWLASIKQPSSASFGIYFGGAIGGVAVVAGAFLIWDRRQNKRHAYDEHKGDSAKEAEMQVSSYSNPMANAGLPRA